MATVNLTWQPGSGGGAVTNFHIYRLDNSTTDVAATVKSGASWSDLTVSPTATSFADPTNLSAGDYAYAIYASNAAGESTYGVPSDGGECANVTI